MNSENSVIKNLESKYKKIKFNKNLFNKKIKKEKIKFNNKNKIASLDIKLMSKKIKNKNLNNIIYISFTRYRKLFYL